MAGFGMGELGGVIWDESSTSLPSFRSHNGGRTLRAAIIHYNGNKCSVTMSCVSLDSRAPPSRLVKTLGLGIMAVSRQIQ
jgi:hypothetical protein